MERTLSFAVNKINGVYKKQEWMKEIYDVVTVTHKEDDIEAVQVYPAEWPRRVRLMVKNSAVKNELLISGVDIFGQHVDFEDDELGPSVVVTVLDTPIEMPFDKVVDILQTFGKIVNVDDEYLNIQGKPTPWKTGTKMVTMAALQSRIPERINVQDQFGRQVAIILRCSNPRFQGQNVEANKKKFCKKCGSASHIQDECTSMQRLCYRCGSNSHLQFQCSVPKTKGFRENDSVYCFRGEHSVLSNFNKQFPITVDGNDYICNEQYIVAEKARMFGDSHAFTQVLAMTDPVKMKQLGNNISNYNHRIWKQSSVHIVAKCNEVKYASHPEAMKVLLSTGKRQIGEATESKEWGIGLSIYSDECLECSSWIGSNKMGEILMKIRDEAQKSKQDADDRISDSDTLEPIPVAVDLPPEVANIASMPPDDRDQSAGMPDDPSEDDVIPDAMEIQETEEPTKDTDEVHTEEASDHTLHGSKDEDANVSNNHNITQETLDWSNLSCEGDIADSKTVVAVVGDANVQNLELDCDEMLLDVDVIGCKDLKISTVTETMRTQSDSGKDDYTTILLHVGSNDFDKTKRSNFQLLFTEYTHMLTDIETLYKGVTIIVSSVLPRAKHNLYQEEFQTVNQEISHFNELVSAYCEGKSNIIFLDNDEAFFTDYEVQDHLYKIHDDRGLLLGKQGEMVLTETFTTALVENCYARKLRSDYDVHV